MVVRAVVTYGGAQSVDTAASWDLTPRPEERHW